MGYDLYVRILNEAVLEERGEKIEAKQDSVVELKVNAHIPEHYISASAHRMEMYKKISLITCEEDCEDIYDELLDRYGNPPRPVERLLEVALAKAVAEQIGFTKVEARGDTLIFNVGRPDLALWSELFSKYKGMRFAPSGDSVTYRFTGGEPSRAAKSVLTDYYNAYKQEISGGNKNNE